MNLTTLFSALAFGFITLSAVGQNPPGTPPPDAAVNIPTASTALNPKLPTVFIAGDSTAAKGAGAEQQGWGVPFADYFDPARINVVNLARGGRSSRTFITDGSWERVITQVKSGDFVLIQFGHNDGGAINAEPPVSTRPLRARGSLPGRSSSTSPGFWLTVIK